MDFGWRADSFCFLFLSRAQGTPFMKSLRKLLATVLRLAIFVGIIGGGYYAYQMYVAEAEDEELGEMLTQVVDFRDITVAVSATGVLQPVKIVEIKSKASGEILEMPVEMGDYLRAGDIIAQIDTRILDQEMKQAEADFESAQIRLEIAGKQYERAKSLHAQDLISPNDLETSEQNFSNAESQFIRSEASLELARERLEDTTVTAPISGTILAKTVEQGQIIASSTNNVSGGTVLIQMADLSEFEIRTLVDEIDIGNVKPGLRVESTVEAFSDMEFEGEVMKIEPQAEVQQSVTTFPVLSRIDNSEGLLLPGMNADVSIIVHERSRVLTVANEAVRTPEDAREIVRLLGIDAAIVPVSQDTRVAAEVEVPTGMGSRGQGPEARAETGAAHGDNGSGADRSENGGTPPDNQSGDRGSEAMTRGGRRGGEGGGMGGGGDREAMRARFENASPEEREQMMQRMGGGRGQGRQAPTANVEDEVRSQTGIVFVLGADGMITPREIVTGVRDWEVAEVLGGLEGGEELVLLPSTSLLRSQERERLRYTQRAAVVPVAGGQ